MAKIPRDLKKNKKTQAKDLARTIEGLLLEDKVAEARAVYDSMSKLGRSPSTDNLKAKAAHKFIHWYADHDQLDQTPSYFQALARRNDNPEVLALQVDVVAKVAKIHDDRGQLEEAKNLRLAIWSSAAEESPLERAEVLGDIINDFCLKDRLTDALLIFNFIRIESLPPELNPATKKLAAQLLGRLVFAFRYQEAFAFVEALSSELADLEDFPETLPQTLAALVVALAFSHNFPAAFKIYALFDQNPERFKRPILRAAHGLIKALEEVGRLEEAVDIWSQIDLSAANYTSESRAFAQGLSLLDVFRPYQLGAKGIVVYQYLAKTGIIFSGDKSLDRGDSRALLLVALTVLEAFENDPEPNRAATLFILEEFKKQVINNAPEPRVPEDIPTAAYLVALADLISSLRDKFVDLDQDVQDDQNPFQLAAFLLEATSRIPLAMGLAMGAFYRLRALNQRPIDPEPLIQRLMDLSDLLSLEELEPLWEELKDSPKLFSDIRDIAIKSLDESLGVLCLQGQTELVHRLYKSVPWLNLIASPPYLPLVKSSFYLVPQIDSMTYNPEVDDAIPENLQLYAEFREIENSLSFTGDYRRLEDWYFNLPVERVSKIAGTTLGKLLAESLLKVCLDQVDDMDPSLINRLLLSAVFLHPSPEGRLGNYLTAVKILLSFLEDGRFSESLTLLEQEFEVLWSCEGNKDVWSLVALISLLSLAAPQVSSPVYRAKLEGFFEIHHGILFATHRLLRLSLAFLLDQLLNWTRDRDYNSFARHMAKYADVLSDLDSDQYTPLEAKLYAELKAHGQMGYALFAQNNGHLPEAIAIFQKVEPILSNFPHCRERKYHFILSVVKELAQDQNPSEALIWLNKLKSDSADDIANYVTLASLFLISALIGSERLEEAQKILDELQQFEDEGLEDEDEDEGEDEDDEDEDEDEDDDEDDDDDDDDVDDIYEGEIELRQYARGLGIFYLLKAYREAGLLEEALAIYLAGFKNEDDEASFIWRLNCLTDLIDSFTAHGETATATHLFTNRSWLTPLNLAAYQEAMDQVEATLDDFPPNFLESDPLYAKYNLADRVNMEATAARLGDKAVTLVQECLFMDEEDRAMAVYRSLEDLPLVDGAHANAASKLLVERLVKMGRDPEARALVNSRSEKLTPSLSQKYLSQMDRLMRPAQPSQKGKTRSAR
ncbi:MAG: hypothetical protein LBS60_12005 [Deltaproteobacteria bacterium]|jgi:hypothetical protein|nr:hypothetical protein [Deltaproteobacteria bacterium]